MTDSGLLIFGTGGLLTGFALFCLGILIYEGGKQNIGLAVIALAVAVCIITFFAFSILSMMGDPEL